jgi:hypothetical protein
MRGGLGQAGAAGAAVSALAAWHLGGYAWEAGRAAQQPADLLVAMVAAVLAALVLRLGCCAVAVAVSAATPTAARSARVGRIAVRLSPRVLRPVLVSVLGLSLGLAAAGTASAAPTTASAAATPLHSTGSPLPSPGWAVPGRVDGQAPSRAVDRSDTAPAPGWVATAPRTPSTRPADVALVAGQPARPQPGRGHDAREVVVRRGDCLWTLAARQLGPDASDAQVSAQWHRWWATNEAAIGRDPDRLDPGTRLLVPARAAVRR